MLTGYDDAAREFTFLNSWGKAWGDGGYGRMSYDFVGRHSVGGLSLDDVRTDIPGATCSAEPGRDAGMDAGVDAGADSGPPPSAGTCRGATECATCTALSGCGWCEGVGCRAASTASTASTCGEENGHPSSCPADADPCTTAATECGPCVAADGCQWCADRGSCYSPALRTVECNDPRNAPDQCADYVAAANCGECAALEGCGWCPGSYRGVVAPGEAPRDCVPGSEAEADRESCSVYRVDGGLCQDDACRALTDCGECLDDWGCGWCDGVGVCMAGSISGPVISSTYGSTCGADWDYFSPFCDNTEDSCASARLCDECLRNSSLGCGWNEGESRWVGASEVAEAIGAGGVSINQDIESCPLLCADERNSCGASVSCCPGLMCNVGRCADCTGKRTVTESCDPTEVGQCCGFLSCSPSAGGGGNACCQTADYAGCTADSECCGEMTCGEGLCVCRTPGQSCIAGRECCGGSICSGGVCT